MKTRQTQTQRALIFSGLANLLLCSAEEYSLLFWMNKMSRSTVCTELTLRLLMSYIYIYIYGAPILDVSRSHTTTQHSR